MPGESTRVATPYVGPRPFEAGEDDLFFGREREESELLSLVTAHRSVLLYAQSGAGKTSLLHAGLLPRLQEEEFEVLPVARVSGFIHDDIPPEQVENVYALNAILSWRAEQSPDVEGAAGQSPFLSSTLAEYLAGLGHDADDLGLQLPRLIVFDQFEELFTAYPDRWMERRGFFEQIEVALEADALLRVLFVIREDYVAELDPYTDLLPNKLRSRFRLERLGQRAGLAAVKGPLRGRDRRFGDGVAEKLVADLTQVRVQKADGTETVVRGEYVEPVQLQVVCETLWEDLPPDVLTITEEHLYRTGGPDEALSRFYERGLRRAVEDTGVTEGVLRNWFGRVLLTPAGTRGTVFRGSEESGGIPNAAVELLENMHLIRAESRGGARWYELSHDRFIRPIQQSNRNWLATRGDADEGRRRLEERAEAWIAAGRAQETLFGPEELPEAERWLRDMEAADLAPSEQVRGLMEASRAAAQQAEAKRARRVAMLVSALAFLAVVGGVASIWGWRSAEAREREAEVARQAAVDSAAVAARERRLALQLRDSANALARLTAQQRDTAEALRALSEQNADLATLEAEAALRAQGEAEASRRAAQIARARAERTAITSLSREVAAASLMNADADPQLGLLLAIEAYEIEPTREAQTALRRASETSRLQRTLGHNEPVTELLFIDDIVVSAGRSGSVRLWDAYDGTEFQSFALDAPIEQLLGGGGDFLLALTGGASPTVRIWDSYGDEWTTIARFPPAQAGLNKIWLADEMLFYYQGATTWFWIAGGEEFPVVEGWLPWTFGSSLRDVDHAEQEIIVSLHDRGRILVWDLDASFDSPVVEISDDLEERWDVRADSLMNARADSIEFVEETPEEIEEMMTWLFGEIRAIQDSLLAPARSWSDTIGVLQSVYGDRGVRVSEGHDDANRVVVDWDGHRFATVGSGGTVRVWDVEEATLVRELPDSVRVLDVAFSPDGAHLATALETGAVRVWNLDALNEEPLRLDAHDGAATAVAFGEEHLLATAGEDGTAKLWDTSEGEEQLTLTGHTAPVLAVAFPPDGSAIYTGGADMEAQIWDVDYGTPVLRVPMLPRRGSFLDFAFARDPWMAAAVWVDNGIEFWNIANPTADRRLGVFYAGGRPNSLTLSADGSVAAAGVRTSNRAGDTGSQIHVIRVGRDPDLLADFSLSGRVWDLALDSGGDVLYATTSSGVLRWELGGPDPTPEPQSESIYETLALDPSSERLALGRTDGSVAILPIGGTVRRLNGRHSGAVVDMAFDQQGAQLATIGDDRFARIWDVTTGEEMVALQLPKPPTAVSFSPDRSLLAVANRDGTTLIFELDIRRVYEVALNRKHRDLTPVECLRFLHNEACEKPEAPAEDVDALAPAELQLGELRLPPWMTLSPTSRRVGFPLVSGLTDANNRWNLNGWSRGQATLVVPEGYTVAIDYENQDPVNRHSLAVLPASDAWPAVIMDSPVFPGAISRNPTSMTDATPAGGRETIAFDVSTPGEYALVCMVPGHAVTGEWIGFHVSEEGEAGVRSGSR